MSTLSAAAQPAIEQLLESDEDQLLEELGLRATALQTSPELAGRFTPDIAYDGTQMGALDTLRELGGRIFRRWEKESYGLVCGATDEDSTDRAKLAGAFGVGGAAVAALITAQLVTAFGLAPAIAAVIAALIIKRFMRPAYEEFCVVWGNRVESLGTS